MKIYIANFLRRIQGIRIPVDSLYQQKPDNLNIFTFGDYEYLNIHPINLNGFSPSLIQLGDKDIAIFDTRISFLVKEGEDPYFNNSRNINTFHNYPLVCYLELRISDLICTFDGLWELIQLFFSKKLEEFSLKNSLKNFQYQYDIFKCLGSDDISIIIYGNSYEGFFEICDYLRNQIFDDVLKTDIQNSDNKEKLNIFQRLQEFKSNHVLKNTYSVFGCIRNAPLDVLRNEPTSLQPMIFLSIDPGHDNDPAFLNFVDRKSMSRREITGIFDVSKHISLVDANTEKTIIEKTLEFFNKLIAFEEKNYKKGSPILWTNTIWSRQLLVSNNSFIEHFEVFDYSKRCIDPKQLEKLSKKIPEDTKAAIHSCIRMLNSQATNPLQSSFVLDILNLIQALIKKTKDDKWWDALESDKDENYIIYEDFEELFHLLSSCLMERTAYSTHTLKAELSSFWGCAVAKILLGYSGIFRECLNSIKDILEDNFTIDFISIVTNIKTMQSKSFFGRTKHSFIINQIPVKNFFDFPTLLFELLHELFHQVKFSHEILDRPKRIEAYGRVFLSIFIHEMLELIDGEAEKNEIKNVLAKYEIELVNKIFENIFLKPLKDYTSPKIPVQKILEDFAEVMNQYIITQDIAEYLLQLIRYEIDNIPLANTIEKKIKKNTQQLFQKIRNIPYIIWQDFDETLADTGLLSLIGESYLDYIKKQIEKSKEQLIACSKHYKEQKENAILLRKKEQSNKIYLYIRKYYLLQKAKGVEEGNEWIKDISKEVSQYLDDSIPKDLLCYLDIYQPIIDVLSHFFELVQKKVRKEPLQSFMACIASIEAEYCEKTVEKIVNGILHFGYTEINNLTHRVATSEVLIEC